MRIALLAALTPALLTACLGEGDGLKDRIGRDNGNDDSALPEVPACEAEGFGAERSWTLPEGLSQLDPAWPTTAAYSYRRCQGDDYSYYAWQVSSLAGGEGPDLLLTRDDCQEDAGLGDASWRLYRNNGGGFQAQSSWTLPEGLSQLDPAWSTTGAYSYRRCGGDDYSYYAYTVMDLDGDGQQDLVLTLDQCSDEDLGEGYWQVYRGRDGGFADNPTPWALPEEGFSQLDQSWSSTAGSSYRRCGGDDYSYYAYTLVDLDGDGLLDLVVTRDDCGDEDLGEGYWRVHPNTGAGFGPAVSWELPEEGFSQVSPAWGYTAGSSYRRCGGDDYSYYAYALVDLDGDGRPDLLNTLDQCEDEDLGEGYWRVFPNTGAGFGAAQRWELPAGLSQLDQTWGYTAASSYRRCGGDDYAYYAYALFDLSGDGAPDLVHTLDTCDTDDPDLGVDHWRVYHNRGDGFDPAQDWALPEGFSQVDHDFGYVAQTSYRRCQGDDYSYYSYGLLDLTGDGLLDLVRTRDDCLGTDLGETFWQVYPGQCGE